VTKQKNEMYFMTDKVEMSVMGIIEMHGSKQVIKTENRYTEVQGCQFIPGDKVEIVAGNCAKLLYRQPQPVLGVVQYIDGEQFTKFAPTIKCLDCVIGDRLVLWLQSDGNLIITGKFSSSCKEDEECLLAMYQQAPKRHIQNKIQGDNFYTIQETVCHDDLKTFTIDPASSVDFDDAISVDVETNTVYIHIVDIAGQTLSGEQNIIEKCFSLYLPKHTQHLLDEIDASHNLSLILGKQRKVITIKANLNSQGLVQKYDIYKSTIVVKYRHNYIDVMQSDELTEEVSFLSKLAKKRSATVNYNVNLPSVKVTTDGNLYKLESETTNDEAHNLVATAMNYREQTFIG
jgi:hypothetical protein